MIISRKLIACLVMVGPLASALMVPAYGDIVSLNIVNPSFETGTAPFAGASGWTIATGALANEFYTTAGASLSGGDPNTHLAGSAVNYVTPTASLGGEVVKGTLVPAGVPGREAAASLTINKLTVTVADLILAVAGVSVLVASASLAPEWKLGALAGGLLFVGGTVAFWVLQRRGQLAGLAGRRSFLQRLLGKERAARLAQLSEDIDQRIADFHAAGRGDAVVSTLLHMAGKAIGAVQLALFFYWMEVPVGPFEVVSIFLVARAIELAAFFMPASLGTQEGGLMLAMSLVSIPVSLGLTFSLVLRLEQVFWTGIGFVAYAGVLWQRRRETPSVIQPTGRH